MLIGLNELCSQLTILMNKAAKIQSTNDLDKTVGIHSKKKTKQNKHLIKPKCTKVFREVAVLPVSQYYFETMEAQPRITTHQKSSTG